MQGLGVGTLVASYEPTTLHVSISPCVHWRHSNVHSLTERPLLGGLGLACKPSPTPDGPSPVRRHPDGSSPGRRHDGTSTQRPSRRPAITHRNYNTVPPTTPPTMAQCPAPASDRADAGTTPTKNPTRPPPQAHTKSSVHDRTTLVHVRSLRDTENRRAHPTNEPPHELSQPPDDRPRRRAAARH